VSQADPLRAVLDADIIYSRVLHELMGRVADDLRLLDLVWSDDLLAEARSCLLASFYWIIHVSSGITRKR
jgi:hypothetical protein